MKTRASVKMPLFYLSTQEFPSSSAKTQIKKQNPVFSHREKAPNKRKGKMIIQLYSRYLSQRDISLSSTNTSSHLKKMTQSKDKPKHKFDSVIIEQSSKAKLSTSINELDQYYLDIIHQKNTEISKLKEEILEMRKTSQKDQTKKKKKKGEISFECLKRRAEDEKINRNSVKELLNINSNAQSKNKIIISNCNLVKPRNGSIVTSNLKQSLNNLKSRAYDVMNKLSSSWK